MSTAARVVSLEEAQNDAPGSDETLPQRPRPVTAPTQGEIPACRPETGLRKVFSLRVRDKRCM